MNNLNASAGEAARLPETPDVPSKLQLPTVPKALARFSLIDKTAELAANMAKQEPLLGRICQRTQSTVLYAKPNTGKTLITISLLCSAVRAGRIQGGDCFYIAADDNAAGVIEKQELMKALGIHVIAPGLNDFSTTKLRGEIEGMIVSSAANGTLIVVDTLKKFADLMDKKSGSAFADLARRYVLAGGTLVGLAHTNKRTTQDGRPIFAGTSDILDDFDCGYTIMELPQSSFAGQRVVQFDCLKRRGNVAQQVAYRYSLESDLTYGELLDTVHEVGEEQLDRVRDDASQERDADTIAALEECIREGITSKQELKFEGAKRTRLGRHKISEIIERYTGADPTKHRWDYDNFGHGRREYRLLNSTTEADDQVF